MCMIVIGFVLLLVLNILISEYVNVYGTIAITAPLVIACYYFEAKPQLLSLIMYASGIVGLSVLRLNSRITLFNNKNLYYIDKKSEDNGIKQYKCIVANKIHAHLVLVTLIATTVFSGVFTIVFQNNYKNSFVTNTFLKDGVDAVIASVVTDTRNGGSKKATSGGLGRGKLGKVSSIKYDNKVDLKVKFVPIGTDTVYLKGYVGSVYEDNSWKTLERAKDNKYLKLSKEVGQVYGISEEDRANCAYEVLDGTAMGIFSIENVDSNGEYAFMPYYGELNTKCMKARNDDEVLLTVNALSYEMRYHLINDTIKERINEGDLVTNIAKQKELTTYKQYMEQIYTVVPKDNIGLIKKVCDEIGLDKNEKYNNEDIDYVIEKIAQYYRENYVYTLSPGRTPEGEDYVNYFIKTQKGFCAHFTSAATLILRYLGIPARYVEGYAITSDIISQGKPLPNEDVSKYINMFVDSNESVIEVSVPDNKAHAWVEVYKDQFGWMPYEMTYYREKESEQEGEETLRKEASQRTKTLLISFAKKIGIVAIVMIMVFNILVLYGLIKLFKKKKLRQLQFNNADKVKAIQYIYIYICEVMHFLGVSKQIDMTIDEYFAHIVEKGICDKKLMDKIGGKINKAAYSGETILDEDVNYIKTQVENIVKIQYNGLSLRDKIKFKLIYNL